MIPKLGLWLSFLAAAVSAQLIGTYEKEVKPALLIQSCEAVNSCKVHNISVTMDENWRWVHGKDGYQNCYGDSQWNYTLCPDGKRCATNCAIEGATYKYVYGVSTSGANVVLPYVTKFDYAQSVASRLYLMASEKKYQMFKLLNKEITFDVDVSRVPCGLNGAFSLVEMEEDGGMARYPTNQAGAQYGTGYCNSKCPRDLRFINGEGNVEGYEPSPINRDWIGKGKYGSCCAEINVWDSSSISSAVSAHPCSITGQYRCSGESCEVCDRAGCDFNSFRMGNPEFYGPQKTINTQKNFTVITQFITDDGTDTGTLVEIRRKYIQNGKLIENSASNIPGVQTSNSITDGYCSQQKAAFGEKNDFKEKGGLASVGKALGRGMVLAVAMIDDHETNHLWLDSVYPADKDPSAPGISRGTCSYGGATLPVEPGRYPPSQVTFGKIRYGPIGSTFTVS